MTITRYHSLVGPQGRGVGAGYQGTRYESPISTFVTRPMMDSPIAPADEPAKKAAVEAPTVAMAVKPPTPVQALQDIAGNTDVPSTISDYEPANPFEATIDKVAMGDLGLKDFASSAVVNTGLNMAAGAPFGMAAKAGLMSAAAPPAAVGWIGDQAVRGIASDQVKGSEYGQALSDLTEQEIGDYSRLAALGQEQYSPAPESPERYSALEDAVAETKARTQPLGPTLSLTDPSLGQVGTKVVGMVTGKPTQTIFDPEVVMPERYRALLGHHQDAPGFDRASIDPSLNPSIARGFSFMGPLGFRAVDSEMRSVPHQEALESLGYGSRFSPQDIASMDREARSMLSHADPMESRDFSQDTVGRVGYGSPNDPFGRSTSPEGLGDDPGGGPASIGGMSHDSGHDPFGRSPGDRSSEGGFW